MVRRVIEIDREKCNGCGACADACQEGAIGMVDGKAALLRDEQKRPETFVDLKSIQAKVRELCGHTEC